jgi:hypothetical protein
VRSGGVEHAENPVTDAMKTIVTRHFSGTAEDFGIPQSVFQEPQKTLGFPEVFFRNRKRLWDSPKCFSGTAKDFGIPQSVFQEPQKTLGFPKMFFRNRKKVIHNPSGKALT